CQLRQRLQLPCQGGVQPAVAISEVHSRVPHLEIEVRCAIAIVQVAAFGAREAFRWIRVVNGVAPRAVFAFELQELGFGLLGHAIGRTFPGSGGSRSSLRSRSMPAATTRSVSKGSYGIGARSPNA